MLMKDHINNRYFIKEKIGQGGMGDIYLVEDSLKGNALFALKAIKKNIRSVYKNISLERFKNEYELMTRLKHPNLVQVYDFGMTEEGLYYIIMEYLKGHTLKDPETKSFSPERILDLFIDVLRALEFIHSRNIIYRDIKPENIMITDSGTKLLDFGISDTKTKEESNITGTFLYMAPEIFTGNIDFRSDVFSLGILFYELFSGNSFFSDIIRINEIIDMLKDRSSYQIFLKEKIPVLNKNLQPVFLKMLNHDKEKRYSKCSEIIADINHLLCRNYEFETADTMKSYVLGGVFINRKEELTSLKRNKSKITILSGAMGLGKTTLFREFKKYCKLQNIHFFDTDCIEGGVGKYYSISEILKQIICICPEHILNKYGSQLRFIDKDNIRLKDFPIIEIKDSRVFKSLIIQNISDFLIEFSEQSGKTSIIYLDDLEYIDIGSFEVIKEVLYKLKLQENINIPLFLFASVNMNKLEDDNILKDFVSENEDKSLKPFKLCDIKQYIETVFGKDSIDESILKATEEINERIGGNPFFLVELLKSMIESRIIIKDINLWRMLKGIEDIKIPHNLTDIVKNRITKLLHDDSKKLILQLLSSLRINPEYDLLKEITKVINLPKFDISFLLTELERFEILHSETTGGRLIIKFHSRLTKETIRETIKDKKEINLKIAHALLNILKDSKDEGFSDEIAYHFLKAGDRNNAVIYLKKSAEYSDKHHFHKKCLDIYDKILKNLEKNDIDSIIDILFKKTKSLENLGKWDEAINLLNNIKAVCKKHKKETQLGEAHNLHSAYLLKKGNYDLAFDFNNKAMSIFKRFNDELNIVKAYHNRAGLFFLKGEYDTAVELNKRSITICKRINNTDMLENTLFNLAVVYYYQGNYKEALKNLETNIRSAKKNNNKLDLLKCYNNYGNIYVQTGDYKKAFKYYKASLDLSIEMGYIEIKCIVIGNIGIIYKEFGKYDKALECFQEKLRLSIQLGFRRGISISYGNIGNIHTAKGNYSKALEYYNKDLLISEELGDKRGIGHSYGNIGEVYKEIYDYQKAEIFFSKLKNISSDLNDEHLKTIYLYNKGYLLMFTGQFNNAHKCFQKIIDISLESGNTYMQAIGHFGIGRIFSLQKNFKISMKNLNKARDIFAEKNLLWYLCLTLLEISEQYLNSNDISKAYTEAQNANNTINKLSLKPLLFKRDILDARLTYHTDKNKALQKLKDLKNTYTDDIYTAEIGYYLAILFHIKEDNTTTIYKRLYDTSSDIIIKERLEILKKLKYDT